MSLRKLELTWIGKESRPRLESRECRARQFPAPAASATPPT